MKKILFLWLFAFQLFAQESPTFVRTFSPAGNYTWTGINLFKGGTEISSVTSGNTNLTLGFDNNSNSFIDARGPITITAQGASVFNGTTVYTRLFGRTSTAYVGLGLSTTDYLRVMPSDGNIIIQNGGTFVNAGYRLDVQGTARFTGLLNADAGISTATGNISIGGRAAIGGVGFNSQLSVGGAYSTSAAFSTTGFGISHQASTITSTAASATIPVTAVNTYARATLAASNATTLTSAATLYLAGSPMAGSNVVINYPYTFHIASGASRFDGDIQNNGGGFYSNGTSHSLGTFSADASALLTMSSTTKGFLPPRMTEAQKNAIVSPTEGLMIYQTNNTKGWYGYDGSSWVKINP